MVISCHHLQQVGKEQNHDYPDGVYKIYPAGPQPIMAYCDMSRDGGGWTLLVTSHTNGWTAENVRLKNSNSPKLTNDYSILQYADSIKDNINVAGSKFEYRLEAQSPGTVKMAVHIRVLKAALKFVSSMWSLITLSKNIIYHMQLNLWVFKMTFQNFE